MCVYVYSTAYNSFPIYAVGCSSEVLCASSIKHTVELTAENSSHYHIVSYCDSVNLTLPSNLLPPCKLPKWYQQPSLGDGLEVFIQQAKAYFWQVNMSKPEVFGVYCVKSSCADQKYCGALAGISCMPDLWLQFVRG